MPPSSSDSEALCPANKVKARARCNARQAVSTGGKATATSADDGKEEAPPLESFARIAFIRDVDGRHEEVDVAKWCRDGKCTRAMRQIGPDSPAEVNEEPFQWPQMDPSPPVSPEAGSPRGGATGGACIAQWRRRLSSFLFCLRSDPPRFGACSEPVPSGI